MSDTYDDDYDSCERTKVELRIYGAPPEWVTESLRISPTSLRTKGAPFSTPNGSTRISDIHAWFLSSENKIDSRDTRRHLDWLCSKLEPVREKLHTVQSALGVVTSVNCLWWSADGHGGPIVSPSLMARLAALELELGFDIYFCDDD